MWHAVQHTTRFCSASAGSVACACPSQTEFSEMLNRGPRMLCVVGARPRLKWRNRSHPQPGVRERYFPQLLTQLQQVSGSQNLSLISICFVLQNSNSYWRYKTLSNSNIYCRYKIILVVSCFTLKRCSPSQLVTISVAI